MSADLASALADGLAAAGVQRVFGLPGGGPNLDMIGAAQALDIPFVLAHGETAACIMASSYGRMTRTPGVAVVTRGPGLTSAANGLAQATLDRFPLLLVSDTVWQTEAGRVAHQRLDQVAAARPLTKYSGTLGTADPAGVTAAAARLTLAGPAGAVYLAHDPSTLGDPPPAVPVTGIDDAGLAEARQLVAGARHPVVVVGLDAVPHAAQVRAALAGSDCPVLATYEAKGVVGESWPNYAGLFTGAAMERPLLEQADLVIGVGLDPVEPMPGPWTYSAPVVLLSTYPVETAYFGSPAMVVGPYGELLPALLRDADPGWTPGTGAQVRRRDVDRLHFQTDGLGPADVVGITQKVLGDALLTVDAGAHMLLAMALWQTDEPGGTLISNGLATMGFALPAAIGAALARPHRRVVCFAGDGGLGMMLAELETLARLRLDVTVVVFNDAALTLIELKQGAGQGGPDAVRYGPVDFVAVAAGMGVPGSAVRDADGLFDALTGDHRGPRLVDAHIDPAAYTHIIRSIRG